MQDNSDTLNTYWNIGRLIVEAQGGEKGAKYGNQLIKKWSEEFTQKYGKGYDYSNLKRFRQFFLTFPIGGAVRHQLSWTHYRYILPIKEKNKQNYYINLCITNHLSSRELIKEIKNKSFERLSYADKENIKLIDEDNYTLSIEDMIKDPIIIEASIDNLDERTLHKYITQMLENRFLELGVSALEDIDQTRRYANLVDNYIKEKSNNNTIGLLISKAKDGFIIEYATEHKVYLIDYELKESLKKVA